MKEESIYKVTPDDLTGEIKDFPIEVVQMMVERQYEQVGRCDVTRFQYGKALSILGGGFNWGDSIEGDSFWGDVIMNHDWKLFFSKYPSEESRKAYHIPHQKKLGLTRLQKWYLSHKELFSDDVDWLSEWTLMGCMTPRELAKAYEELNLYPYFEYVGNSGKESCFLGLLRNAKKDIERSLGNLKGFTKREFLLSMYEYPEDELLRATIGWIKKNPLVMYRTQRIAVRGCNTTIRVRRLRDEVANLEWEYKEDLGVKKSNAASIYLINGMMYEIY